MCIRDRQHALSHLDDVAQELEAFVGPGAADLADHHRLRQTIPFVADQDAESAGLPILEGYAEVEDIGDEPRVREGVEGQVVGQVLEGHGSSLAGPRAAWGSCAQGQESGQPGYSASPMPVSYTHL